MNELCVPEMAEKFSSTNVGKEHVEAMGVLVAPEQGHNEGVTHLSEIDFTSHLKSCPESRNI